MAVRWARQHLPVGACIVRPPRSSVGPTRSMSHMRTEIYRYNTYLILFMYNYIYNYVHTCDVVCTYGIYMHLHAFTSHRICQFSLSKGSTFCIVEVLSSCRKAEDSDSNSLHSKEDSGMASGPTDWVKDLRKS